MGGSELTGIGGAVGVDYAIKFIVYSGVYESTVSTSYLPIGEPIIDPGFVVNEISCVGANDATIISLPIGGTGPYSFLWDNATSLDSINELAPGVYFLTITDALGCTESDSIQVFEQEVLIASISNFGFDTICINTGSLTGNAEGGVGPYTFNWSNNYQGPVNDLLSSGEYTLTLEDVNGCQEELSYTLYEGDDILINIEEYPCFGEEIIIEGQSYFADTSFCTNYAFDNGCDSTVCYIIDFSEEQLTAYTHEICQGDAIMVSGTNYSNDTILVFDFLSANGCDSTIMHTIEVIPPNDIVFETTGSLCNNEDVEISVNGFANYNWSNGMGTSSITVLEEGYYSLTATNNNNCVTTDSIFIASDDFEIYWSTVDPNCFGEASGQLVIDSIIGGEVFSTSLNGTPFSETVLYEGLTAGIFDLEVLSPSGCIELLSLELYEPEAINIQAEEFIQTTWGSPVTITVETNAVQGGIAWSPNIGLECNTCFENTINVNSSITYTLTVVDGDGCTASTTIQVDVDDSANLFIPNVFSPNGDGFNDYLKVYGSSGITNIIDLTIIHPNGHAVYQSQNFIPNESQQGWDGTFLGQKAQAGVYVLYVKYETNRGEVLLDISSLTLVR